MDLRDEQLAIDSFVNGKREEYNMGFGGRGSRGGGFGGGEEGAWDGCWTTLRYIFKCPCLQCSTPVKIIVIDTIDWGKNSKLANILDRY